MSQKTFNILFTIFLIIVAGWVGHLVGLYSTGLVERWHMSYYRKHNYPIMVYKDTAEPTFGHYT